METIVDIVVFWNCVFIVALISAFILSLMRKWGVIEYVQVHGNDFFSKMFNCNFCLSWWVNVVLSIIAAIIVGDINIMCVPLCATVITREMI